MNRVDGRPEFAFDDELFFCLLGAMNTGAVLVGGWVSSSVLTLFMLYELYFKKHMIIKTRRAKACVKPEKPMEMNC